MAEKVLESATAPHATLKLMGEHSDVPAGMGSTWRCRFSASNALAQRSHPGAACSTPATCRSRRERALLYAALDKVAEGTMEWLSPAEKSRWFAAGPKKSRAGKHAAQFQRWYAHLAQASAGKPNLGALRGGR